VLRTVISAQQLRSNGVALGTITASFGVAASPLHGRTAESLLRNADEALYEAKHLGRNQVCVKPPPPGSKKSVPPPSSRNDPSAEALGTQH
jgi:diguanylate cyclase (GGDEF)-like protein